MTHEPTRQNEWQSSAAQWDLLKPEAQRMRKAPTAAEQRLWQELCGRKVAGVKFRRQHAIDRFIVDFCSNSPRLIIEVDGGIHEQQVAYDAGLAVRVRNEFSRYLIICINVRR